MSKITYADKVALNENPNVADVNKIKADDLNEIKNVVNANDDNIMKIAGKILYKNPSGSNTTITLNDAISNYSYLEIYGFEIQGQSQVYTKYDTSSGKNINLYSIIVLQTGNLIRIAAQSYTPSGTALTIESTKTGHANIFDKVINEQNSTGDIKITKVIGIK